MIQFPTATPACSAVSGKGLILLVSQGSLTIFHIAVFTTILLLLLILYLQFKKVKRIRREMEKSFHDERKLFNTLVNSMPDRIYIKDKESRFIIGNRYVASVMGTRNPDDLVGKTDFDFYQRSLAQKYFDDEQEMMKTGLPIINKEEAGLDPEGNEKIISTTKIPVIDEEGNLVGLVGIGRDITEQKKVEEKLIEQARYLGETNAILEERQEEIQQLAEELNAQKENLIEVNKELEKLSLVASRTENIVVIMDGNGNFQWVNQGFIDLYGYPLEEYIRKNGSNLRDNSSNPNISVILNQIYITGKPYTYSSSSKDRRGNELWFLTNISPIFSPEGDIEYLILIDSNITELKQAEIKINQQKKEIESQRDELTLLNATKDKFFSIIAHDLKNPFHSIIGFTDLIKRKLGELENERIAEFVDLIGESSKSAYQLLENLLQWARSQTNRISFNPEQVEISALLDEIISVQKYPAEQKGISIQNMAMKGLKVKADKNMIETVFRNLIANAIKFSSNGGNVICTTVPAGKFVEISVIDSGIGIQPRKVKSLFSLEQVESTAGTEGETGTGLGLILCHEFTRKNGGKIEVTSTPGKGSTFTVSLPAR
ncbi:MAG: PAS domain-containing sensor histidine kinase [Bacteroidota bacterium]